MLRVVVLDLGGSWKEHLTIIEFAHNNSYQSTIKMAPYEALYRRKCRSPLYWDEDRQKSYVDKRRKDLVFQIGDEVFLKVAPAKEVVRFGQKGKLKPRYIGPYEFLERIGEVAYKLALPPELSGVHDVFNVSMLRRYVLDPSHVTNQEAIQVEEDLTYEEFPVAILDRKIHSLRNRDDVLVKVQWSRHGKEEATWEREDVMDKYPNLSTISKF
ncbi:hypothetical protein DH2020_015625 [Rehmannia glutinosa]|uniref:Tf2-1-like SH3-like domain-containing protein n=1 Tax=Rehmannia glutinosa TaxID=99300 RepID=A0ABR0WUT8_REHGL